MNDANEFEAFVRRYQDMVYATAARLLGNRADAEDVAQTVFLRAFQHFSSIGRSDAAAGWLKTAARNASLNHLLRYRNRWSLFSELSPDAAAEPPAGSEPPQGSAMTLDAELDRATLRERLESALRLLPDHQRVPLVLFHFEQLSYQEIADTLGISIGKVKTDIHRGREALKPLMKPFEHS